MAEVEAILNYQRSDNGYSVYGVLNASQCTYAIIPQTYYNEPVIEIASKAFSNCIKLKEVIIKGTSLRKIRSNAFDRCYLLSSIKSQDSNSQYLSSLLTNLEIEVDAFEDSICNVTEDGVRYLGNENQKFLICVGATGAFNSNTYVIPESTQVICENAFRNCNNLQNLQFSMGSGNVGKYAFAGCSQLKKVIFKSIDTSHAIDLKEGCFKDCIQLNTVILPDSLRLIENYVFDGCYRLAFNKYLDINYLGSNNSSYKVAVGPVRSNISKAVFHPDCHNILSKAFINTQLTDVTINAYQVGDFAFSHIKDLQIAFIDSQTTYVGHNIFDGCSSLEHIVVNHTGRPNTWESDWDYYPDYVTLYNYSISNIFNWSIEANSAIIHSIKNNKWNNTFIYYPSSIGGYLVTKIGSIDGENMIGGQEENPNIQQVYIANGIEIIGYKLFNFPNAKELNLPESITKISPFDNMGSSTLYKCSKLIKFNYNNTPECFAAINLPTILSLADSCNVYAKNKLVTELKFNNIENIEKNTFFQWKNLNRIHISASVKNIGDYAFSFCSNIEQVIIPDSVINIGNYTFNGCTNLKSVILPNKLTTLNQIFKDCQKIKHIKFPSSLTKISNYALYGCTSLESLELPSNVSDIGGYAFYNCSNLKSILLLSTSVPEITTDTFKGVNANLKIYIPSNLEKNYKEHSIWKNHTDKLIVDDLKIYFARFTRSQQESLSLYSDIMNQQLTTFQENLKQTIVDTIFPVGSIYLTMNDVNPSISLGGIWEELPSNTTIWVTPSSEKLLSEDKVDLKDNAFIQPGLPAIVSKDVSLGYLSLDLIKQVFKDMDATIESGNLYSKSQFYMTALQWLGKVGNSVQFGAETINSASKISIKPDFEQALKKTTIGTVPTALGTLNLQDMVGLETTFDASNCSPIYGNSKTVQPPAIKTYGWRRIG